MRDYISASSINLFLTCPTAYFLKYEMGMGTEKTNDSYARYGTMVHEICEKMCNGGYLFLDEAEEEYIQGYPNAGLLPSQHDGYYEQGLQGIRNAWEFFEDFRIQTIGAEVKFNVKPFEDIPKYFGFIDLVYRDENGSLVVKDYKTSKVYDEKTLAKQIQPYFYAEACLAMYGELPKYFEFDFIRFGEKRTIVTDETFLKFNRVRMQGIWKQIANRNLKSNWSPFFCENFCSGRSSCPLWQEKMGGR